jgi:probable rRNA maturation factor
LRVFLIELVSRLACGRGVTCLITTDAELRRLNRQFRGEDYATDVLSFPPDDIAISLDRAAEQAKKLGHSLEEEVRILMLHGLLHLRGMDHETDSGQMRRAETSWRKRLGLPSGLIERAK